MECTCEGGGDLVGHVVAHGYDAQRHWVPDHLHHQQPVGNLLTGAVCVTVIGNEYRDRFVLDQARLAGLGQLVLMVLDRDQHSGPHRHRRTGMGVASWNGGQRHKGSCAGKDLKLATKSDGKDPC